MIKLRYGNTNTFFIPGDKGGLLLDTDYAGTLPAFYKAIKGAGVRLCDMTYVLATHYHPDHIGLVGELTGLGVKWLLIDAQVSSVHFSDAVFKKDKVCYVPLDEAEATVISCKDSRAFLSSLGIRGEILYTPSHSPDSVTLLTDDGNCFAGDMMPYAHIDGCEENEALKRDWQTVLSHSPETVFFSHRPEQRLTKI